ncbi:MAG: DUF3794 domain-containing protein, partial [Clostridiaceae bacterium]|nr:DUF3794 domain-containing protein [Clostridiaceae bacterium]
MMVDSRHESICISEAVINAFSRPHAEIDIIVPDTKPDIAKVLQVDAHAVITSKECAANSVLTEGKINLNILYIGENNKMNNIRHVYNFKDTLAAESTTPDMNVGLECDIENIEYEVINSRKMSIRTITAIDARIVSPFEIHALTGVSGAGCEKLFKSIKPYHAVMRLDERIMLKERLEVPAGKPGIASVLKFDANIGSTQVKTATNKIVIKGTLNIVTLFVGDMDENAIQFMEHEMPFTEVIDVDGADEQMAADIDLTVCDITYQTEDDDDGDCRVLIAEADIFVSGKIIRQQQLEILEDIYSTDLNLCVAKDTAMLDKIAFDTKTQLTVNDIASIPADLPEIIQVYNIIAKPYLTTARVEGGKVIIEGIIDTYILYLSDDIGYPIYTYKHESNFIQHIDASDADNNALCDVKIGVEHVSYNIG